MSDLDQFARRISDFSSRPTPFQVEAFAWYIHEILQKDRFETSEITRCFDELHIPRPANVASSLTKLSAKKPARVIRDSRGYRLASNARDELSILLPARATAVRTTRLLQDLLEKVVEPRKKTFLNETLVCFSHQAYRAAVVMAWNLAFAEVLDRIFQFHLAAFNSQVGTFGFKSPIQKLEDFADLKEGVIISLARNAKIMSKDSVKVLEEKLDKRNTAAHPSNMVVESVTAEEVIFDLVQNIILKPTL